MEALWYHRSVMLDDAPKGQLLLNFEAVDYRCEVWVNGQMVGEHTGGSDPFSLDIASAAKKGENELLVKVTDATGDTQLRGKQRLDPKGIWYTRVSGIWQTVWLEQVGSRSLESLDVDSSIDSGRIAVMPKVRGGAEAGDQISIEVIDDGRQVAMASGAADKPLSIVIPEVKLWSPASPHLYDLRVKLIDQSGAVIDEVASYTGLRRVGKKQDENGDWRFTLNGETIFHWGPLDQGWWPDGLLTPPSDEAMQWEIGWLKDSGFNMIRKHIKIEPRRYYYHCDKMGMMVWQDQVSAIKNPEWTRFKPDPEEADWTDAEHEQFMLEFERMISVLDHFPSIVVWTPFNEAWGQHRTMAVGKWATERDPTRLINIASGGNFWPVGDIADWHQYPHPSFPFDEQRFADYILVVGEFGGHGWPVQDHVWDANRRNWGYGGLPKSADEYKDRVAESIRLLIELKDQGIAAGVYTQTTDVEGEINGLITYDRKVAKISAKELNAMTKPLTE
jgi:beta-galactosidase